uniref:NADH-ubiquinone oxidoreductase chain 6 n=1 Tax=Philaenus spumarius TaxID=36667 RepID=Q6IT26_PHISP|nr:NADH dehydrogenase subunit 6 [Philaenus spumarius]AAT39441.1 NADH dehydrogenase subunit 6 [Philaenus spumarius]
MKMMIMMSSIMMSTIFSMMKHPLSMGMILLIQTLITCLMNGLNSYSMWFSYILFITFIGGMLILFIYIASIASNEKFLFSMKMMMIIIFMMFMLLIMSMMDMTIVVNNHMIIETMSYNKSVNEMNKEINSIMKMFNMPTTMITLMTIIYLLFTMITVVKVTNMKDGPLRMKN